MATQRPTLTADPQWLREARGAVDRFVAGLQAGIGELVIHQDILAEGIEGIGSRYDSPEERGSPRGRERLQMREHQFGKQLKRRRELIVSISKNTGAVCLGQ